MSLFDTAAMRLFLKPGMALMRGLRFPAKITLMAIVLLAPLSWLTGQALLASHASLEATRLEARGNPLLRLSLDVIAQVQKHRGLVNRRLAGDEGVEGELVKTRSELKATVGALQSALIDRPEFDLGAIWQPARQALDRLAQGEVPNDAAQSFQLHTAQIEALRRLISRAAEVSGLLLDPEGPPFHLMHFTVEPLAAWTESLGQLRGRGAAMLNKGQASVEDYAEIVAQVRALNQTISSAEEIVAALQRAGEPAPDGFATALTSSRDYAHLAEATFAAGSLNGHAAGYFDAGTAAIAKTIRAGQSATQRLQTLLDERAQRLADSVAASIGRGYRHGSRRGLPHGGVLPHLVRGNRSAAALGQSSGSG